MRWFVDGMNVIGTRPDGWWKDRDAAMLPLVDLLERWAAAGEDVMVVFERPPVAADPLDRDRDRPRATTPPRRRRRRDHAPARRRPRARPVRVVTSDRWLADRARAAGASVEGPRCSAPLLNGTCRRPA